MVFRTLSLRGICIDLLVETHVQGELRLAFVAEGQ